MLKAVHAQEDHAAARAKAVQVAAKLREMRLGQAATLVEAGIEETFSYYALPREHWRSIRTNNPQERIMREIRRRTRAVGALAGRSLQQELTLSLDPLRGGGQLGAHDANSSEGCALQASEDEPRGADDARPLMIRALAVYQ